MVQKGYGLLGLAPVGMSLEEIFLHLTTTDTASGAPARRRLRRPRRPSPEATA